MSPNQNIKTSQKHNSIEPMYYAQFSLLYGGFFFKDIYERQFLVFLISYFRLGTRSRSCSTWSLPTADSAPSATPFTAQTLLAYLSWDNIQ